MAKNIDVVVIHGSHKHADGVAKVGDTVSLGVAELKALDPQFSFKKGIGERFASPAAAEKLNLKRQLDAELEADGMDEDQDEPDETEDMGDESVPDAAPTPPDAPAAKAKGKKKSKEG